jgi:putative ABC transport system permease protein
LVVFNLATLGNLTKITEQDFVQMPRNLVSVPIEATLTAGKVQQILGLESIIDYSTYRSAVMLTVRFEDLYQGSGYRSARGNTEAFPVALSNLDNPIVLAGRLPANETEFAIDAWVADRFLENKAILDLGIIGYEEMLGGVIEAYEIMYSTMTLVGIVETNAPVIVLTDANEFYFNRPSLIPGGSLGSAAGQFTLTLGSQMLQDGEVLLPSFMSQLLGATFTYAGKTFTVVGKYEDSELSFIVTNADFRDIMLSEMLTTTEAQASLLFFTTANDAAISELGSIDVSAEDMITVARTEYLEQQREEIGGRLQTILISLGGAVVFIFFAMRSSMLGRIKEIGVYRSIGATKADIYKIFISEILAFTTIGSLTGYLFMTYIVNEVERMFAGVITVFHFPITMFVLGISGIYLVILIFGMIPIYSLLRKTPSEINAKFDI